MLESVAVCAWVGVQDGCPVTCEVLGSGMAAFEFGARGSGLEMQFDSEALRRLIDLASGALRDMDERHVRECAQAMAAPGQVLVATNVKS